MAERRYDDEEMAAIFQAASEGPQLPVPREAPREEGLTLADLQAIGREVGISPDAVARAAKSLDVRGGVTARTILGLPIGVARTVNLGRAVTDAEWERLVVQLREVFNARGVTRAEGTFRQWTNGNLQVLLEPAEGGHRLRFGTVNGRARAAISAGLFAVVMSAFVGISAAFGGHFGSSVPGIAILALTGLGMTGYGAFLLPGWARLRGRQMDALAAGMSVPPNPATAPPDTSFGRGAD